MELHQRPQGEFNLLVFLLGFNLLVLRKLFSARTWQGIYHLLLLLLHTSIYTLLLAGLFLGENAYSENHSGALARHSISTDQEIPPLATITCHGNS